MQRGLRDEIVRRLVIHRMTRKQSGEPASQCSLRQPCNCIVEVSRNFTVTGFALPVNMVYSDEVDVRVKVPGSAANAGAVKRFVSRLVMQRVFDVLERQCRSVGLPDAKITAILGQLAVQENKLFTVPGLPMKLPHCIIFGNTVTALCTAQPANIVNCNLSNIWELRLFPPNTCRSQELLRSQISSWRIGRERCGKMS
ncbi:hypothetical protein KIN20_021439 [Parelaphostrongylus tenuis]|uniref:Uncharacterized protein n=1 Tax=Parelaphostrongylus tenuis TaxID=148309 RepID=A0AAD5MNY2_PARTN|nr:hypothetical protein KIN20_021439 [Parelaphostrongylus tenuis]